MVSDGMPFSIPVGCFMFHTVPFAFTSALMCLTMVIAINSCIPAAVMTAVMAAPMSVCHDRHGKTT